MRCVAVAAAEVGQETEAGRKLFASSANRSFPILSEIGRGKLGGKVKVV